MITLHDYLPSQNGYKVRLLLAHLRPRCRLQAVRAQPGFLDEVRDYAIDPGSRHELP